MLSLADASIALKMVARELGKDSDVPELTEGVRVHTLRQIMDTRFGAAAAWQAMNKLWRSGPRSPGVPEPADQSQYSLGVRVDSRNQPRWIESLHDPSRIEREWQADLGIGSP
jgi:hypothetical protein